MGQRYAAEAAEALQARGQLIRSRATENVPRDSRSLASEALWQLGEKLPRPGDYEDEGNQPESVPLASLPSFFQQQVQTSYQKRRAESEKLGEPNRPAPTQVGAKVYLFAEALLPNLRARARISFLPLDLVHPDTPLPQPPPPVRWPGCWTVNSPGLRPRAALAHRARRTFRRRQSGSCKFSAAAVSVTSTPLITSRS